MRNKIANQIFEAILKKIGWGGFNNYLNGIIREDVFIKVGNINFWCDVEVYIQDYQVFCNLTFECYTPDGENHPHNFDNINDLVKKLILRHYEDYV